MSYANYHQQCYECSRQNASIKISNSEYINEFSDGIKLNKGDTVRLLGSFIQEGSDSNEIELDTDLELNISFNPYVLGNTIDTLDAKSTNNLLDLSQIGDVAYSTDSFGIEPPMRNTNQKGDSLNYWNNANVFSPRGGGDIPSGGTPYPLDDASVPAIAVFDGYPSVEKYENTPSSDPAATGETGGDVYGPWQYNPWFIDRATMTEPPKYLGNGDYESGTNPIRETMRDDASETWGSNLITNEYNAKPSIAKTPNNDYDTFKNNQVSTEMYIGNMVKKFILPVIDFFETGNTEAANANGQQAKGNWADSNFRHVLEPLTPNHAPSGTPGMWSGVPKVGQYITTIDIAQSSGWFDSSGTAYWENTWSDQRAVNADYDGTYQTSNTNPATGQPWVMAGGSINTGIPNVKSGVQSVIGEIIAVRPIKHHILGKTTDCFEIYVTNFVNPAELIGTSTLSYEFDATTITRADSYAVSTTTKKLFKQVHGSGELDNGYNFSPSFNNLNGADNTITGKFRNGNAIDSNTRISGVKCGDNSGTPTRNNYLKTTNSPGPEKLNTVQLGGTSLFANQINMGLGMPQGLSFLWNGTHTGYMKNSNNSSPLDRYRGNSWTQLHRYETGLTIKHLIEDFTLVNNDEAGSSFDRDGVFQNQGTTPVCCGAYVILPKESMLQLVKGQLTADQSDNYWAAAGRTPRIWMDFAFQTVMSGYTTRHYTGNSWNTDDAVWDPTSSAGNRSERFPYTSSYIDEKRYGYCMIGRPPNVNWRASFANDGRADRYTAQNMNTTFSAPSYHQNWNSIDINPNTNGMPLYLSSRNGSFSGSAGTQQFRNLPVVNGGYNTCINSVHFQQKETGDTKLGVGSYRVTTTTTSITTINTNTIEISGTLIDLDTGQTRVLQSFTTAEGLTTYHGQYQIKVLFDDCQFSPVELIGSISAPNANVITIVLLTGTKNTLPHNSPIWLSTIPLGTKVIISYLNYAGVGAGITALPWSADMIMIKESVAKIKVSAGNYTEEQLARTIDDALHYNTIKYKAEFGVADADKNIQVPTNVGIKENARTSQPSIINGTYVQTQIPDISYGFSPITESNAVALDLQPQTKELTSELYTYETLYENNNFVFYYPEEIETLRPYNGTTTRKLSDNSVEYPTKIGKHFKIYSVPYISKEFQESKQLILMRLRGGALNTTDFDVPTGRWNNVTPRSSGNMEILRSYGITNFINNGDEFPTDVPWFMSTAAVYAYRTRLTRNLFPNGGSAKIFVGANNFTLSWEQESNRYSLNNLYTPIRPHEVESPGSKDDFGINDAVPSAIICAKHTGESFSALTGIYINNLNTDAFTQENWGLPTIGDHYLYDTLPDEAVKLNGQSFLDVLGYSATQLAAFDNSFNIVSNPFIFKTDLFQDGSAIRVVAKLTPSINASNPIASKCLNIAPVQQFFVEIETDDFFATSAPTKNNDPYYFIGSDLMDTDFYGNLNGSKLPIAGICARNFSAFNFVFDLGGSAISFIVKKDAIVHSIKTAIYTSNMKNPSSLAPNSSIIYLITRNNYLKNLTPQEGQQAALMMEQQQQAPLLNSFYSQPSANIRTALPPNLPPKNSTYFQGFGKIELPLPPLSRHQDITYDSDGDTDNE